MQHSTLPKKQPYYQFWQLNCYYPSLVPDSDLSSDFACLVAYSNLSSDFPSLVAYSNLSSDFPSLVPNSHISWEFACGEIRGNDKYWDSYPSSKL